MFTDIGIDLGTYKTSIISGRNSVIIEPSVVAVDTETGKPLYFGKEAKALEGRTDECITVVHPIVKGVVSDMDLATRMIRFFLKKSFGNRIVKPRVVVTAPGNATAVEQRSATQIVQEAGGRQVNVIETVTAAAIGLGLNFNVPKGNMIVDIGAGITEIAVISMGGVAQSATLKVGSADFDDAIVKYVRRELGTHIGPHTAERIKIQIGSAVGRPFSLTMQAGGVDINTGKPRSFSVTSAGIYEAISDYLAMIAEGVTSVLEKTTPELSGDIAGEGIVLIGSGALMFGFEELISTTAKIPCKLAEEPSGRVLRGAGIAVRTPELFRNSDYEYRTRKNLFSDET